METMTKTTIPTLNVSRCFGVMIIGCCVGQEWWEVSVHDDRLFGVNECLGKKMSLLYIHQIHSLCVNTFA